MICYNCIDTDHTTHQAPVIKGHPQDVQIQQGYKVTLDVITDETASLSYQWYFEDNKINGMLNHCVHCVCLYNQLLYR